MASKKKAGNSATATPPSLKSHLEPPQPPQNESTGLYWFDFVLPYGRLNSRGRQVFHTELRASSDFPEATKQILSRFNAVGALPDATLRITIRMLDVSDLDVLVASIRTFTATWCKDLEPRHVEEFFEPLPATTPPPAQRNEVMTS